MGLYLQNKNTVGGIQHAWEEALLWSQASHLSVARTDVLCHVLEVPSVPLHKLLNLLGTPFPSWLTLAHLLRLDPHLLDLGLSDLWKPDYTALLCAPVTPSDTASRTHKLACLSASLPVTKTPVPWGKGCADQCLAHSPAQSWHLNACGSNTQRNGKCVLHSRKWMA